MHNRIPTIDVFSGIGGFSYALSSICKTVAYCEKDQHSCAVLEANMARGNLDKAPIFRDVKALYTPLPVRQQPVMLTAGFPCQDISPAAIGEVRKGLKGARSSLILSALSFVEKCPSIKVVLLENSSWFVNYGMDQVMNVLKKMNFHIEWGVFTALQTGAPHLRRRFYLLAVRGQKQLPQARHIHHDWTREPCPRMIPYTRMTRADMLRRAGLLGNAIVPQTCIFAYNCLSHKANKLVMPVYSKVDAVNFKIGRTWYRRVLWATPTRTHWHQYRNMQPKSAATKLVNQIYYDKKTQAYLEKEFAYNKPAKYTDLYFSINPEWLEWLQGYPSQWTHTA